MRLPVAAIVLASLLPAPVLAYAKRALGLADWQSGLPLAVLGIGIGAGSALAGKVSGAKVEYGLLPFGALGLTLAGCGGGRDAGEGNILSDAAEAKPGGRDERHRRRPARDRNRTRRPLGHGAGARARRPAHSTP